MKKSRQIYSTGRNLAYTAPRSIRRDPLARNEVHAAFRDYPEFSPILSLEQAAKLAHFAPSTVKRLVSEGYFGHSVRRGKPVAFWRDRFVVEVMDLDRARDRQRNSRAQTEGR